MYDIQLVHLFVRNIQFNPSSFLLHINRHIITDVSDYHIALILRISRSKIIFVRNATSTAPGTVDSNSVVIFYR